MRPRIDPRPGARRLRQGGSPEQACAPHRTDSRDGEGRRRNGGQYCARPHCRTGGGTRRGNLHGRASALAREDSGRMEGADPVRQRDDVGRPFCSRLAGYWRGRRSDRSRPVAERPADNGSGVRCIVFGPERGRARADAKVFPQPAGAPATLHRSAARHPRGADFGGGPESRSQGAGRHA